MDVRGIQSQLAQFAAERNWDQFHSPKNLCMALAGEVGELIEHFQWATEQQSMHPSSEKKRAISEELADVFIYTLRLSDKLGVDIEQAVRDKIEINAEKYPVNLAKDNATKYSERS